MKTLVYPPVSDLVYSMTRNEEDDTQTVLEQWPNTELLFQDNPSYQETIRKVVRIVSEEISRVEQFSLDYNQYCAMVDVCRLIDVDSSMKRRTWAYNDFNSVLLRHVTQVSIVQSRHKILRTRLVIGPLFST